MKINFSKEEYRVLIELLDLADWVIHAQKSDQNEQIAPYRAFIQKIYAKSEEMEMEDSIEYVAHLDAYMPTRKFEESAQTRSFIEEFIDEIFWEELIYRLAQRDFIRANSTESIRAMSTEERVSHIAEREAWYAEQFEQQGLDILTSIEADGVPRNPRKLN